MLLHSAGSCGIKLVLIKKTLPSAPVELICYFCVFLRHWAGLQKDNTKQALLEGASAIQSSTVRVHEATRNTPPGGLMQIAEREDVEVDPENKMDEDHE